MMIDNVAKNKSELFAQLDSEHNPALNRNEQSNLWDSLIKNWLFTFDYKEKYGDNNLALLQEYIDNRRAKGLKADYD